MTWWQRLRRRRVLERQLDAELRDHLERLATQYIETGLSTDEAWRRARLEFGGLDQVKEICRDTRGLRLIDAITDDLLHAWKGVTRQRWLSLMTASLIAMSVALAGAASAFLYSIAFRELSAPRPQELVLLSGVGESGRLFLTSSFFERLNADRTAIKQLFFSLFFNTPGAINATPRHLATVWVRGDYFSALGASPAMGRLFDPEGQESVVVISDHLWRTAFGTDPDIIGKPITIGLVTFPIVGVTPPEFLATDPRLNWDAILSVNQFSRVRGQPFGNFGMEVGARLAPGITRTAYEARLNDLWPSLLESTLPGGTTLDQWRERRGSRARVESLRYGRTSVLESRPGLRRAATLTVGLSVLILVIVCVTLALLAVARGVARQRQTAIMLGLGSTRGRLFRVSFLESGMVALVGSGVGLLLAVWIASLGTSFLPGQLTQYDWRIRIPPVVFGIALLMAVVATLISGLLPAALAFGGALRARLQWGAGMTQPHVRLRTSLLVVQLALSLLLVHYALVFMRDLRTLSGVESGINVSNLHIYPLTGTLPSKPVTAEYIVKLIDDVKRVSGTNAVALSGFSPFAFQVDTTQPLQTGDGRTVRATAVCAFPGFFDTVELPLVSGADFSWTVPATAVISATLAETAFAGKDALSQTIKTASSKPLRIIGVVKDVPYNGQRLGRRAMLFLPCFEQANPWPNTFALNLFVRSPRTLNGLAPAIQSTVAQAGAHYVYQLRDAADDFDRSVQQERMLATVGASLAVLIVLVTGVGLYAFASYVATWRAREFAIRSALGASRSAISASLLREVAIVFGVGSVCGVGATLGLRTALEAAITAVPAFEREDLVLGILTVALTVTVATFVPTWRTLRLDLARVLRVE